MNESMPASKLFFQTRAAQIAVQSLDRIVEEQIIGMVIASPGLGKTQTIKFWRKRQGQEFRHISIEADVLTSCWPILNAMAQGLGLETKRSKLTGMKLAICAALAANPVPILVDEADLLTVRTFELLRSIWDRVAALRGLDGERGFPLALFGAPRLRDMLGRPDLERLHRRIFHRAELPPLNAAELATVLKKWEVECDAEGFAELLRMSRGSFGWLNVIIPLARKLAAGNGHKLTARVMRSVSSHLIGLPGEGSSEL